ncbi:hypothetical protein VP01_2805g1 [Puccinia sorghi]|uniref:Integrase catalytic domain-containing protein n=1 Tax=Puccinia sorghi TaxID=27349 RepID=A0A0L6V2I3_9BASI|nr:hypothetical protein VP01_2805g1 [Puccinia sorghi]
MRGRINNGLYSVENPDFVGSDSVYPLANVCKGSGQETLREIHEKFGHPSIQRIESLIDRKISAAEKARFECKHCILAKITKQQFQERSTLASKPFERIHLDLIGPIKPESTLKHWFILTVVDNHSGYLAGFPLVHKDDTTDILINLIKSEKNSRGYYPSTVCSDGGGEFVGNRLAQFFNERHIHRLISKPYHPEHNGRAERANRTIVESIRATVNSSGIAKKFWHEILKSCCLGLNQIPKKNQSQSPWEVLHGKQFPANLLRAVGTPAVILTMNKVKGRKFDAKGEEGKLVGFNIPFRSFQITQSGKIVKTKHV